MISNTLSKMMHDKKGYRTENYSGSGIRNLEEILKYEIGILGNTDVLAYLKKNHNILSDFELDKNTIKDLKEVSEDDKDLKKLIIEEEQEMVISNSTYFIEQILNFIEQIIGTRKVTGLWLTTIENVVNIYGANIYNIDKYSLPKEYIVISDLSIDGALFVFKNN